MQDYSHIQLLGELTAHQAAYQVVLEALHSALERFDKSAEPLLREAMEMKLNGIKGELLYLADPNAPADDQRVTNAAFHQTFDSLSAEILESVTEAFSKK